MCSTNGRSQQPQRDYVVRTELLECRYVANGVANNSFTHTVTRARQRQNRRQKRTEMNDDDGDKNGSKGANVAHNYWRKCALSLAKIRGTMQVSVKNGRCSGCQSWHSDEMLTVPDKMRHLHRREISRRRKMFPVRFSAAISRRFSRLVHE